MEGVREREGKREREGEKERKKGGLREKGTEKNTVEFTTLNSPRQPSICVGQ